MTVFKNGNVKIDSWFNEGLAKEVVIGAAVKGAKKWAQIVKTESQQNTPVLSGILRNSHAVTIGGLPSAEEAQGGNAKSKQGTDGNIYISANTPYARRQHEEHKSKAKFLERAFNAHIGEAGYMVESEIAEALLKEKYSSEAEFRRKYPDLKYEDYKDLLK